MKKLVILSVLAASLTLTGAAFADTAAVSNLQGKATIVRASETLPVTSGMTFQKGDVLKTSPDGTLDVALNDLAGVRVLGGSEVIVEDPSLRSMAVKITSGNAILNLKKLPPTSTFRVETPTAVAAVRGTQFWGRVDHQAPLNPVTTFAVREGSVDIAVKGVEGASFTLKPGQALDIAGGSSVPVIRPALPGEMDAMAQADTIHTSA